MNHRKNVFSRRELLEITVALGGLVIAHPIRSVLAQEAKREPTPEQIMGPFYPIVRPRDHDMEQPRGARERG